MKLKILISILILLIIVNLATLGSYVYFKAKEESRTFAAYPPFPGNIPQENFIPPRLDLNREQRERFLELKRKFEGETKNLWQEVGKLREEILTEMQKDSFSMDRIEDKLEKIAQLRLEIEKRGIQNLTEAREFLTPPQRQHLFNFLMERPGFRSHPMMRGRGPGNRHGRMNKNQIK